MEHSQATIDESQRMMNCDSQITMDDIPDDAVIPIAEDSSGPGLNRRLEIGGYKYREGGVNGDKAPNQPFLNAMATITDHLKPGDTLEKQRIIVREQLQSQRVALSEAETKVEQIKLKIEELQGAEQNLSRQIEVENTNWGVVEKLRTAIRMDNNQDFEDIVAGLCMVAQDLADTIGATEGSEERKRLLVMEMTKIRAQCKYEPIHKL